MFGFVLCCLFSVILAQGIYPPELECFNFGLGTNCTIPELPSRPAIITPIIDGGIYPFAFGQGNLGLSANISFVLNVDPNRFVGILVFDCFCLCDTFGFLINGVQPELTYYYAINYNVENPCETYVVDPWACLERPNSVRISLLPAGLNNITITAGRSPLNGGAAYAWIYNAYNPYFPIPSCLAFENDCNLNPIFPPQDACENTLQP